MSVLLAIKDEGNGVTSIADFTAEDEDAYCKRGWEKDFLAYGTNCNIYPACVPKLSWTEQGELANVLNNFPKIKRPRPDLSYGLEQGAFPSDLQISNSVSKRPAWFHHHCTHLFFTLQIQV